MERKICELSCLVKELEDKALDYGVPEDLLELIKNIKIKVNEFEGAKRRKKPKSQKTKELTETKKKPDPIIMYYGDNLPFFQSDIEVSRLDLNGRYKRECLGT